MGDKQLKVYTHWLSSDKPEIRRLEVESLASAAELFKHLISVYPALEYNTYDISWKDEEGDDIRISTDKELQVALKQMPDIIRIHVHCKEQEETVTKKVDHEFTQAAGNDTANAAPPCPVSYGVVCDGCEAEVVGVRYKCIVCDDYDLCAKCEGAGQHADHFMLRIPRAGVPRGVIRAAIKRSRNILKNVASKSEEHCKLSRADKNSERKRSQHASAGGRVAGVGNEQSECTRKRINWIDSLTMYMNEFANLAGDIQSDLSKQADPQPTYGQETPVAEKSESTDAQKNNSKAPEGTATKQSKAFADITCRAKIGTPPKVFQKYLVTMQNVPRPSTSKANNSNEEIGQGDRKTSEDKEDSISDKEGVTSDVSSQTIESKKDDTPDRVDGWTVINISKDKDLFDACMKPSTPQQPAAPIAFNLPEEFQQRFTITQGQSLYPPLNFATAVLDPKEAEPAADKRAAAAKAAASAAQAAASAAKAVASAAKAFEAATPQDSAATKPTTKPQPMAHISAALEQMLNMGFTNEGGWLTQLLESKDGNIYAVLDLLTPVTPKK